MSEWIKVEDQLPEENQWVLCFLPYVGFDTNRIFSLKFCFHEYCKNGKVNKMPMFSNIDRSWRLIDSSHWMPLPIPPGEHE